MATESGPLGDITNATPRAKSVFSCVFNLNTFLKSVSTSKSRVIYDLDTDRVTYDLDTTTHKIIVVVGSPLHLATPVFHCSWKCIHVNHPCPDTDSRVFCLCFQYTFAFYFFVFLCFFPPNRSRFCFFISKIQIGGEGNIFPGCERNSGNGDEASRGDSYQRVRAWLRIIVSPFQGLYHT